MKHRIYFILVFIYFTSLVYSQKCTPKFPLKDGWLGGDGNVSVPINEDTTFFFFSDSFVGKKNQKTRLEKGLKMVSNSVAIHTCLPNGETHIRYFWNNMYSRNPKPIFKTKKKKNKFWIVDAFKFKNDLYVLLEKIGPKKNAAPNDIFNFSSIGYDLVKITNIYANPTDWNMTWIPLNDFNSPAMGLSCHMISNNYIFFFINRHDKEQVLVRKNIDLIDNSNIPFEYYAKNNTWKEGLNYDNMKIVVDGFRSTTVKYHPDLKQWVMIIDIWFMDNKIKMRTSPLLTGPWSEEKTIFEIPEMTPGHKSFAKNNFCYLPRECIQNYDSENHLMLITYDVNNSNLSEVLSNPEIYTPKVITVPIGKEK